MAAWAQVFDAGLPDRGGMQAAVVRGSGSNRRELARVLGEYRRRSGRGAEVRVQRHVAAVPGRAGRACGAGDPCAGPLPHRGAAEKGGRRGASGRSATDEGGWPRAGAEAFAVVLAEAAGESDGAADDEAGGAVEVQPADGAGVPAQGGSAAVVGVRVADLGGEVFASVDHAGAALAAGAHEESGPEHAEAFGFDPQLVRGARHRFGGLRRGQELSGKVGPEKRIRISGPT